MSFNGSGTFVINSSGQPVSANTLIEAAVFNAFTADIATGLSTAIAKDGQTTVTANLPMAGYRLTGLGAGTTAGHSLRYEQLFSTSAVTLLGAMNWVKGADIASATTINLTTATGNAVHVTGTTQIDAVTLGSGMWRMVIFDGILTLAHHATNNNLPGGANITTAANDRALYWSDGTTVYCASYFPAIGLQPKDAELTALAGLTSAANKVPMFSGSGTATLLDFKDEDNMASNSATAVPSQQSVKAYADASSRIVQIVEATPYTTHAALSTAIPDDDTIPQNTEGTEIMTVTITPTNASNRLRIEFDGMVGGGQSGSLFGTALFQDSTANAIAARAQAIYDSTEVKIAQISHEMAAGTTSATTFKIRCGSSLGTAYVNGTSAGRKYGGVMACRLRVTEIKV